MKKLVANLFSIFWERLSTRLSFQSIYRISKNSLISYNPKSSVARQLVHSASFDNNLTLFHRVKATYNKASFPLVDFFLHETTFLHKTKREATNSNNFIVK